tara:strand:+ start:2441 stop:3298 length:858 start_codon:yes stop_codon:yes gene_type:complete
MNIRISILLFIALFSVSTSPIIAEFLKDVPAISISFWRMFIAALILWTYSLFFKQGKVKNSNNLKSIFVAGILLGIHFALFFQSIKMTKIANATFLGTLAPLFTLLLESFLFKRKFNKFVIMGLLLSFCGAVIILSDNFDMSQKYTLGNFLAVLCSVCLAISFIIAEKVRQTENTIVYTRTLYLTAAATLLIIAVITNSNLVNHALSDYIGLLFLGLVPTIIGHNIIYYSVKFVSPTIVSSFPLGEPVIATILAFFIFGQIIGINIILGGLITLFGLLLIINKKK